MRKLLLLRPEPGLSASAQRARALELDVIACPLFVVEAVDWDVPDPTEFDVLLMTSANAVRHGGAGLAELTSLPVWAVGEATAEAARAAGFTIERVGSGGVEELLADAPHARRLLHLAGEEHRDARGVSERRIVYRSGAIEQPGLPPLNGLVVAVHSPRAGRRLAEVTDQRVATVAAISVAAAEAVGHGWEAVEVASSPDDLALLALAAALCQKTAA